MGQTAEMGTAAPAFCCSSLRRCRLVLQRLPPPCGEKNLQLLQISPFSQLQKRDPPPPTPRLSRASVLLMGRQQDHLFGPSKDRTGRPCTKAAKITRHLRLCSLRVCKFRCGHERSIVPTAVCHSHVQLTNM